jgi:hypothetical protein
MERSNTQAEEIPEKKRLEPWEELPADALKKVNALTDAAFQASNTMEVNLATDPIKVSGQNWACVSFVSPESSQKCKSIGMKIRGVFDTRDEAVDHVKRLIRLDPVFDIFVCDMYNWCLVPPDPEHIADQTYQDETLNSIIGEYRKNQIFAKEHFEERKREMMEQAADELKRAALKRLEDEKEEDRLKKLESESQQELEKSQQEHGDFIEPADRFTDVTEVEDNAKDIGSFDATPKGFVTASQLMESMMGGCSSGENVESDQKENVEPVV